MEELYVDEAYKIINKILNVEKRIDARVEKKEKFQIGDKDVLEYQCLMQMLPKLLSADDLIDYHNYVLGDQLEELEGRIKENNLSEKNNETKQYKSRIMKLFEMQETMLKNGILESVKDISTLEAYSAIESAIDSAYQKLKRK